MNGYRWANPGVVDVAHCHVCGALCDIRRGVLGPRCMAEAMARLRVVHDAIRCPHSHEGWHDHAVRLRDAIEETPSGRVAALMRQDLDELLAANRPA